MLHRRLSADETAYHAAEPGTIFISYLYNRGFTKTDILLTNFQWFKYNKNRWKMQ